jgi:hypothetical protein
MSYPEITSTHGFSMLQEDEEARREFAIHKMNNEEYRMSIITQWKDEVVPVISRLRFSKLGLIMLQNMVTEALTNMEAHCVFTKES